MYPLETFEPQTVLFFPIWPVQLNCQFIQSFDENVWVKPINVLLPLPKQIPTTIFTPLFTHLQTNETSYLSPRHARALRLTPLLRYLPFLSSAKIHIPPSSTSPVATSPYQGLNIDNPLSIILCTLGRGENRATYQGLASFSRHLLEI